MDVGSKPARGTMTTIEQALRNILDNMDIPEQRKDVTKLENLDWLRRNMAFRNKQNPNFGSAKHFLKQLLFLKNPNWEKTGSFFE